MKRSIDVGGWIKQGVARLALLGGLLCASCADPDTPEIGRAGSAIEIGPEVDIGPSTPIRAAGVQATFGALRAGDHYLVPWVDSRQAWPDTIMIGSRLRPGAGGRGARHRCPRSAEVESYRS